MSVLGRDDEAIEAYRPGIELRPQFLGNLIYTVISLTFLGRLDEARAAIAPVLAYLEKPGLELPRIPATPALVTRFQTVMSKLGWTFLVD